ncbi:Thymidylate synthase [Serratia fonticola]|uniref:Thymidylate synthase n=1 Tax=Serratia fonticola TaxID=47917 RepID=A0A4U9V1C5_SERFO|nr:Thymidylate synthase [Serratia fonticola]
MKQYLDLMNKVLAEGTPKADRTALARCRFSGHQMRFNLQERLPVGDHQEMPPAVDYS